jgi:RNA polymerase sigma-70 factor, ECF subfamily
MATSSTLTLPAEVAAAIPDDEAQMIRRAQAGDGEAFGVLFQRHQPSVLSFVRSRLRHRQADAEDITTEVFITALNRLDAFHFDQTSFINWLLGIAQHKMLERRRWQGRHRETELRPEWHQPLFPVPGPEETICLRLELARLLSRLTPQARQVMILQHLVGLSPDEVARTIGLSRNQVHWLTSQARAVLTDTPNWAARPGEKGARILPPALCTCGCGAELPADRPITQHYATPVCREQLRWTRRRARQHRLLDAPAQADPATDNVLAVITASGPDGIARRELGRRTRLVPARLDRILALLSARGQIRQQRDTTTHKPTTRYYTRPRSAAGRAA